MSAESPTVIGTITNTSLGGAIGVSVVGDYAYVAASNADALTIVDISSPSSLAIVGSVSDGRLNDSRRVAVSGGYAFVAAYSANSLTVVDVSTPSAPTVVGSVTVSGPLDVAVSGDYAFVAANLSNSLTVVDVSTPSSPTVVGSVSDTYFLSYPNSVAVSGDYAFVSVSDRLTVVDVSTPSSPTVVGSASDNTLLLSTISVAVSGDYAFVAAYNRLTVVDVSTPSSPTVVGSVTDTSLNSVYDVALAGHYAFVAGNYADALIAIDVSTPSSPTIVGSVTNTSLNGAYGVAVAGMYAFVAAFDAGALTAVDVSYNTPPLAPTLVAPADGATLNRQQAQTFTWQVNDPNVGDAQSAYNFAYRFMTATTWTETGWIDSTVSQHTVSAGVFTAGDYEWRVATKDSQGAESPWSSTSSFMARDAPLAPSIISPTNNATIPTEETTLSWSTPNQSAFQIRVLDEASSVVYDTGQVTDELTRSYVIPFPTNLVSRTVQVRVFYGGLWSPWSSVTVTVSYAPPLAPTLYVYPVDVGLGPLTGLLVTIDDPTPGIIDPTVVYHDVWVREQGTSGGGMCIAAGVPASEEVTWYEPVHNTIYEVRVKSIGDNGTSSWSSWYAGAPAETPGVVLHDPLNPTVGVWLRYNNSGAKDEVEVENAVIQYYGEQHQTVDFGGSEVRTVEIPLVQSDVETQDDWKALVALIQRRTVLCYRDRNGRKVFGVVSSSSAVDARYGHEMSFVLTETDYHEGVEVDY